MSEKGTIEQRLSALEHTMAEVLQQLRMKDKGNWVERMAGSFKDDPDFDEILRLGREIRQADRPREQE